jgi:Tfp pilus assembly protein PilN
MSVLGIYFGPKTISLVETKVKKVVKDIQISVAAKVTGPDLEEKVPEHLKIDALLREELRRTTFEATEASLVFSGKDLIIRTFEMPVMQRDEQQGAINFEVKKYIPFKVEELVSDYQLRFNKSNRTNLVLFAGIKKDTLDKYISVVSQLNMKVTAIDYSGFSIVRFLDLAGVDSKGVIGILNASVNDEDESNFIVLEDGFPVFSRDIALSAQDDDFKKSEESASGVTIERLKSEIRVSLDYYRRKFPSKDKSIKEMLVLVEPEHRSSLESFITDMGLFVKPFDIGKCNLQMGRSVSFSLPFFKAYGGTLAKVVRSELKIDLLSAKTKVTAPARRIRPIEGGISGLSGIKVNPKAVVFGLLICLGAFLYGLYRIFPVQQELQGVIAQRPPVSSVDVNATLDVLQQADTDFKQKIATIDNLIKKQLYLTDPLDAIPRIIPEGMWLTNFTFTKSEEAGAELVLEGICYLADNARELEQINKFLTDLKANEKLNRYFSQISISSIEQQQFGQTTVSKFFINCKQNKQG